MDFALCEQTPLTTVNCVYLSVSYIIYQFYERVGERKAQKLYLIKKVCGFLVENEKRLGPWTWQRKVR